MVVDRHRYGVVAIIGRPNVGKSTLLNRLVGEKISITSRKPQTTRHSIRGILTLEDAQFVFVDTPGYQREHRGALNAAMNRNITRSLADIDAVVLVIGPDKPQPADITMLDRVPPKVPVILAINMIDKIDSRRVFEILGEIGVSEKYSDVVPISAKQGKNVDELLNVLKERLPFGEAAFPADELTDRDERFLAAERIREKLFRNLGDEVPYGACVVIEKFTLENGVRRIHAAIIVDREGHKPIIIGARGDKLKTVGSAARLELERLFHGKVYLELWVKVRRGWTDNESLVDNYGHV